MFCWQAEPDLCEQAPEPLVLLEVGHVRGMLEPHELLAGCLQQLGVALRCGRGRDLIVSALDHHDGGVQAGEGVHQVKRRQFRQQRGLRRRDPPDGTDGVRR